MAARIQLLGAKELIGAFQKLSAIVATRYVDESLQAGAEVIRDAEIRLTPRRTGLLRSQYTLQNVSKSRTRIEKALVVGPDGFYWRFLEKGTRYQKGPKKGQRRMQPHPWLAKTFKNRRTQATQTVRDTFRDQMLGFEI